MQASRKTFTMVALLLVLVFVWWLTQVDKEISKLDIVTDEAEEASELDEAVFWPTSPAELPESVDPEQFEAFYAEYRLQRERSRSAELELLKQVLENENASEEGKREAELQMMKLVETMEKEMMIENMLKAQGFEDAVFFYHGEAANVVVNAENLSDAEFMQIAETVAGVTGVRLEDVTVVEHRER